MQTNLPARELASRQAVKQVFLVDSNTDDIALTRRALARVSFAVHLEALRSTDAFIQLFQADQPKRIVPDLVLLDLNLTALSSLELLRWIRRQPETCHTPVVVVSSIAKERDIELSYEYGASSFIQKALDFTEYAILLKEVCTYWLSHNVMPANHYHQAS